MSNRTFTDEQIVKILEDGKKAEENIAKHPLGGKRTAAAVTRLANRAITTGKSSFR